ncbi:MAG: hydrolase [Propionibacteriaceae bacterium]|jgi:predicted hydrolase (HD superfamily)|nr:hydrolase [Propionibacteriaceae bacterium]
MIPTIEEAKTILATYNQEPFHRRHGEVVCGVMGYFAGEYDPERVDFWAVVGLLHDIDFEMYPEEHCVKGEELLRAHHVDEAVIRSAMSHGWGVTEVAYEPEHVMEKILFAVDELSGLIGAAALMRPSKSVADMEPRSVKKKFKDKSFAAGCSREIIERGAAMLGWELDDLIAHCLTAMQTIETS